MPNLIPPESLQKFCAQFQLSQAVLLAFDGERVHVVTWGNTPSDSDHAAEAGNALKKSFNWPNELCRDISPKVQALLDKVERLKEEVALTTTPSSPPKKMESVSELLLGGAEKPTKTSNPGEKSDEQVP